MENLIGFVHFDRASIKSNRVEGLVIKENASNLLRNKFVKIINATEDKREFIGRILEGPFFQPEEVSRDSALAQVSILRGNEFPIPPSFYAIIVIEVIGELRSNFIRSTSSRPTPQSRILNLEAESLNAILGLDSGNLLIGNLEGYPSVLVKFDSKKISIIPRNVGIFGTVGSGKTNTAQVLIEELAERETADKDRWAVIVLDVEGEYTMMNKPDDKIDPASRDKLNEFLIKPQGLHDFHVLKLCKHDSMVTTSEEVTINIDQIDEYLLSEILQTTEPQSAALFSIIDSLKKSAKSEDVDDVIVPRKIKKSGYTLDDIIKKIDEHLQKSRRKKFKEDIEEPQEDELLVRVQSLIPLKRKLSELKRTQAFDDPTALSIDPDQLLKPGRVTVFDLSFTGDYEKNLLIAQLLERIFKTKKDDGKDDGKPRYPKTIIIIEEAHSFVSRDNKDNMVQTIRKLKEIARRGRKRWLSLCFISQQPAHLPSEIFELANTRIVHNIRSKGNLEVLKTSSGDVTEEMWDSVPSLGVGQAIINGPQFKNSLVVEIRHCRSKRIKQEDL